MYFGHRTIFSLLFSVRYIDMAGVYNRQVNLTTREHLIALPCLGSISVYQNISDFSVLVWILCVRTDVSGTLTDPLSLIKNLLQYLLYFFR